MPVFSAVGYLTSPYSVNSSANFVVGGNLLGEWMAKEIGGKGNVLIVEGIPGASASDSQNQGVLRALKKYPDIKVVGSLAGMWTDQVAQAEIQKWLATNPGELDGIIIQSASELGAVRALLQSGRPDAANHHRRRDRRTLLLAQEPEIYQRCDSSLAAGRRLRDGLEHHDAHPRGSGAEDRVDPHQTADVGL